MHSYALLSIAIEEDRPLREAPHLAGGKLSTGLCLPVEEGVCLLEPLEQALVLLLQAGQLAPHLAPQLNLLHTPREGGGVTPINSDSCIPADKISSPYTAN